MLPLITFNGLSSFYVTNLSKRFLFSNEGVQGNSESPNIEGIVRIFLVELLDWSIESSHRLFNSSQKLSVWLLRRPKICYQKYFFVSNELLEDIVRLEVTVHNVAFVNIMQRDAYHCENSNYVIFLKKFLVTLNNILQALIAFFHDYTRKIIFVFDDINEFTNHWMFKRPHTANFSLSFSQ